MVDPWRILGIAPTHDLRWIKKAYAARLKHRNPEDDPEGFQELRQAYEQATEFVRWQQAQTESAQGRLGARFATANVVLPVPGRPPPPMPPATTPPATGPPPSFGAPDLGEVDAQWAQEAADELMERVKRLRDEQDSWHSERAWKEVLQNEALWSIDTRAEFQQRLFEWLAVQQASLPPSVCSLLEEEYRWSEQRWALYRSLPPEQVDRVLGWIEHVESIGYAERCCDKGLYREAVERLEPLVGTFTGEMGYRVRVVLARGYLGIGMIGKAERIIEELLRGDPEYVPALLLLARILRGSYLMERAPERIRDLYLRVLRADPKNQEATRELKTVEAELAARPRRTARPRAAANRQRGSQSVEFPLLEGAGNKVDFSTRVMWWSVIALFILCSGAAARAVARRPTPVDVRTHFHTPAKEPRGASTPGPRPSPTAPSAIPGASHWTPPEHPDPVEVFREAVDDAGNQRYQDALAKHLWFHRHALNHQPGLSWMRLTYALQAWHRLALLYPPALSELRSARDEAQGRALKGLEDPRGAFVEFAFINEILGEDSRTAALFEKFDKDAPTSARVVFGFARRALVREGRYELCGKYLEPERAFSRARARYRKGRYMLNLPGPHPWVKEDVEGQFTDEAATIIALLAVNGRQSEGVKIARAAEAEWEDTEFHAALASALRGVVPEPWVPPWANRAQQTARVATSDE